MIPIKTETGRNNFNTMSHLHAVCKKFVLNIGIGKLKECKKNVPCKFQSKKA